MKFIDRKWFDEKSVGFTGENWNDIQAVGGFEGVYLTGFPSKKNLFFIACIPWFTIFLDGFVAWFYCKNWALVFMWKHLV